MTKYRCALQIRLRTALSLILCLSVLFGWLSFKRRQIESRRLLCEAITKDGGRFFVSVNDGGSLSKLLWGDDHFERAYKLEMHPTDYEPSVKHAIKEARVVDACSLSLRQLPQIKALGFPNVHLHPSHFKALGELTWLTELNLRWQHPNDADLLSLHRLRKLQKLDLRAADLTADGLAALENFSDLEELDLAFVKFEDAGLQHVGRLKKLKWLELSGTKITGRGLAALRELRELQVLSLGYVELGDGLLSLQDLPKLQSVVVYIRTDAEMEQLASLSSLRSIVVFPSLVSDKSLRHLARLPLLEKLNFSGVTSGSAEVNQLKKALPRLKVDEVQF